jgi:outer membrane protein OmpA-like peptidoglycan-associated protein
MFSHAHVDQVEESYKKMKILAAIGALGLMASGLLAQGLNPPGDQTKESWEEINFEFNSSILSDGYPSLLRLADLLSQHKDYQVKVTGNTDYVGSAAYNDKLALRRAEAVKAFLVKYGAAAGQITTAGDGKRTPEVNNRSKEGRFMNRRVRLEVRDGSGKLIKDGGIGDILEALNNLQNLAKQQLDCCAQILKRLDKLDDILAALKGLQGENDNLKSQINDLRNQHNLLKDQVAALPKPLNEQQTQNIAHTEAMGALDEAQKRNQKFSNIGANIGPNMGPGRAGNASVAAHAAFFSPFGGDGKRAVQAQGEYMYNAGASQEGQFDIGLVNRFGPMQAGAFASFKYLNFKQYQNGGGLGQGAFMLDYIFSRGRVGAFITKGFKNYAVLNNVLLAPGAFMQTYARVVDQLGASALVGTWGNAYLSGNVEYLRRHLNGKRDGGGGEIKLTQPISEHVAFTAEADYDATYVSLGGNASIRFGVEVGNYIHPKDYGQTKTPVPMDVPRIRYEIGTRRVGSSPPIADAGPNQIGIPVGNVTLNGTGSYDPLGEALTYNWVQISGPTVTLNGANTATATFAAAPSTSYAFRLTVKNTDGLQGSANTAVSTAAPAGAPLISQFGANPANIQPGQSSTLVWVVQGATSVTIQPGVGNVNATSGSSSVSPTQTTTYTLTATGPGGSVNQAVTVQVGGAAGSPQIIRFEANPLTISPGGTTTLSWATSGASQVSISGVGNVNPNGSTTVSPTQTTTYTLTAAGSDGKSVTAPITVTVTGASVPQIVTFVATPQNISPGQSTKICWQVNGSTSIDITPGVGSNLNANDCATVTPATTTTYTLTATNGTGQIQGNVTVNVGTVQILSFTASPSNTPAAGTPVVLSWQTANATSVVLIGGDVAPQSLPANGTFTVNPISNQTYTLTAYGPGGQTVSVTISVFVR